MSNNGSGPKHKRNEYTFTFESTGRTVTYTHVPLKLLIDFNTGWKRKHPAPPIPQNEVEIGGEKRVIDNPTDPDYLKAKDEWEVEFNNASYRYLIKKAIVLSAGDLADVMGLRREAEEAGGEIDTDDAWCFLFYIASDENNAEEVIALQNAILRLSQPTEAAISDAKERFPDTVSGT